MNQEDSPVDAQSQVMPLVDFYRAENYTREDSIAYLMKRILAVVSTAAEDEFRANDLTNDLTNAQWAPLYKLYTGEAATVAELARECLLDAGAMTRLLDRIEAKGLCRRVRSSEDRRVVNIELTDAGRAVAKTIPGVLCRVQNAHLVGFTRDEWVTLKSLLNRLLENALTIQAARKPDGT
jgi:DNA-binding MarR family transcriptional regulator